MAGGISALFGSDTGVREVAGLFLAALIGGYFGLDARDTLAFLLSLVLLAVCSLLPMQMLAAATAPSLGCEAQALQMRRSVAWFCLFSSPLLLYHGVSFLQALALPAYHLPQTTARRDSALPPNRLGGLMSVVDPGLLTFVLSVRVLFYAGSAHRDRSLALSALASQPVVQLAALRDTVAKLELQVEQNREAAAAIHRLTGGLSNNLQSSIHVIHRVGAESQETEEYVLHLEQRVAELETALSQTVRLPSISSKKRTYLMLLPLTLARRSLFWALGLENGQSALPAIPPPRSPTSPETAAFPHARTSRTQRHNSTGSMTNGDTSSKRSAARYRSASRGSHVSHVSHEGSPDVSPVSDTARNPGEAMQARWSRAAARAENARLEDAFTSAVAA